ncbi:MAG: radical SAM family heme chaperone HemW [Minwuiales bacterium]|nr:radical SAM family heme chaperone HemW [Minwuiales bacterium]
MPVSIAEAPAESAFVAPDAGFGLYVHWPFCLSKCPYCDFNSHVRNKVDLPRWQAALLTELAHYADQVPARPLNSVFFGGGTPSLMPPETVAAILDQAKAYWPAASDLEVTLEANPTTVEAARFAEFRDAGANRLSLGVQSLDDKVLRFLGRGHDAAEALAALEIARDRFDRVSIDLIYATPGQTEAAWRDHLKRALAAAGEHISLYQLTIEPNTGFAGAVKRGEWTPMDDDPAARLFQATQEITAEAGLPAYEISNHARPGAECRHNLTYWRYGTYIGVGPGAHGRVGRDGERVAVSQTRKPEAWLEAVERDGHGTESREPVPLAARAEEAVLMGLRLTEGIALETFATAVGCRIEQVVDATRLSDLIDGGFLELDDRVLRATESGRRVLNAVLTEILTERRTAAG